MIKTLKELIDQKRTEVSDLTYDNQRESVEQDMVEELEEAVKLLSNRVDDVKSISNYHEAELNEINTAIEILIEAVTDLQTQIDKKAEL